MKRTSKKTKSWKDEMLRRCDMLDCHYQKALDSPSFRHWMKVFLELCKILFSILVKKVIEHFFEGF